MTPDTLLAAAAGAGIAAGPALAACGLLGCPPAGGQPPPRWAGLLRRWSLRPWAVAAALAAGLGTFAATGWPVAAIAAVPAAVAVPRILSRGPARARLAKLEALEAWTRRLAEVLAASRALEEALIHSAEAAPAAIARPAHTMAGRLRARGADTTTALRAFAAEIDDPVGDLIATALVLAAEVRGPGLHAVLTELAGDVARDISGRREVEAARASYRSSLIGTVLLMAGFLVFLILNRSYSAPFGTSAGQVVLAIVAGSWAGALYWLRRLDQMTGPRRFLPSPKPGTGSQP